jgi:molecular chaperone DnaK (HSP70)
MGFVGIDFGTTNSAVAVADDDGSVQLVPLGGAPHWRTVLYFEPGGEAGGRTTAGAPAMLDDVLARAGAAASEIDRVFATGGSSLVPAVRDRLIARFGAAKLVGGEALTSVAWGLAARAHQVFGGRRGGAGQVVGG